MITKNQAHIYFLNYNLCSCKSEIGRCSDYRMYVRTETSLNETAVREKFRKSGLEFTLYSLRELDFEQIQELGFDLHAIPIIKY